MATHRWVDRTLPAPSARFAFARIAESTDFAPQRGSTAKRLGLDPLGGAIAVLADGAEWIWNRAGEQFPGSPQVLDVFHAPKYVGDAAKSLFGEGTPEAKAHSERGRDPLLVDGYPGVQTRVGEMLGAGPKGGDGSGELWSRKRIMPRRPLQRPVRGGRRATRLRAAGNFGAAPPIVAVASGSGDHARHVSGAASARPAGSLGSGGDFRPTRW